MAAPDPSFAQPAHKLAAIGLEPPGVARQPSPGQGLALNETGAIPPALIGTTTGQVTSGGSVTAGTGFTVNHSATGTYAVTFTTPYAAAPTVIANATSVTRTVQITAQSTSGFTASITDHNNAAQDAGFNFVAFVTA